MINPGLLSQAVNPQPKPKPAPKPKAKADPVAARMAAYDREKFGMETGGVRPQGVSDADWQARTIVRERVSGPNDFQRAIAPKVAAPTRPAGQPSPLTDQEATNRAEIQRRRSVQADPNAPIVEKLQTYSRPDRSRVQSAQDFAPNSPEAKMKRYDEQTFGQATNGKRPQGVSDDAWMARTVERMKVWGQTKDVGDAEQEMMAGAAFNPRTRLNSPTTTFGARASVGGALNAHLADQTNIPKQYNNLMSQVGKVADIAAGGKGATLRNMERDGKIGKGQAESYYSDLGGVAVNLALAGVQVGATTAAELAEIAGKSPSIMSQVAKLASTLDMTDMATGFAIGATGAADPNASPNERLSAILSLIGIPAAMKIIHAPGMVKRIRESGYSPEIAGLDIRPAMPRPAEIPSVAVPKPALDPARVADTYEPSPKIAPSETPAPEPPPHTAMEKPAGGGGPAKAPVEIDLGAFDDAPKARQGKAPKVEPKDNPVNPLNLIAPIGKDLIKQAATYSNAKPIKGVVINSLQDAKDWASNVMDGLTSRLDLGGGKGTGDEVSWKSSSGKILSGKIIAESADDSSGRAFVIGYGKDGDRVKTVVVHEADLSSNSKPESPTKPQTPKAPEGAKEPWQMTREEWARAKAKFKKSETHGGMVEENPFSWSALQLSLKMRQLSGKSFDAKEYVKQFADKDLVAAGAQYALDNIAKENFPKAHSNITAILKEAEKAGARTDKAHRAAVQRALSEGKPVPPEVLADYPDLKPKVETPEQSGSGVAGQNTGMEPTAFTHEVKQGARDLQKGDRVTFVRESDNPLSTEVIVKTQDGKEHRIPSAWIKRIGVKSTTTLPKLVESRGRNQVNSLLDEWEKDAKLSDDGAYIVVQGDSRNNQGRVRGSTRDFLQWLADNEAPTPNRTAQTKAALDASVDNLKTEFGKLHARWTVEQSGGGVGPPKTSTVGEQFLAFRQTTDGNVRGGRPIGINQKNLSEATASSELFHETSLSGARGIITRVESGPRDHTGIYVSDNKDLAIGQAGQGYRLVFDPMLSNGRARTENKPGLPVIKAINGGTEYTVEKTLQRAVKAIEVKTQSQLNALRATKGFESRFDFDNVETTSDGYLRVNRKQANARRDAFLNEPAPNRTAQTKAALDASVDNLKTELGKLHARWTPEQEAAKLQAFAKTARALLDHGYATLEEAVQHVTQRLGRALSAQEKRVFAKAWEQEARPVDTPVAKPKANPLNPEAATGGARRFEDPERILRDYDPTVKPGVTADRLADSVEGKYTTRKADQELARVLENKRTVNPTPEGIAMVTRYKRDLMNEANDIYKKMEGETDQGKLNDLLDNLQNNEAQLNRVSNYFQESRSLFHQTGQALQIAYEPDYTVASIAVRGKAANLGADLEPKMMDRLKSLAGRLEAAESKLAAMEANGEVFKEIASKLGAPNSKPKPEVKERAAKLRTSALSSLKKLGITVGPDVVEVGSGGMKGKQVGAVNVGTPGTHADQIKSAIRRLARSYLADGSADSLDTVLRNLSRDVPGMTKEQFLTNLHEPYAKNLLEADTYKRAIDAQMRHIKEEAIRRGWTPWEKGMHFAGDVIGTTARGLQAGLDASFAFIQGGRLALTKEWMQAWNPALKALFAPGDIEMRAHAFNAKTQQHPNYPKAVKAGLGFQDMAAGKVDEIWRGDLIKRVAESNIPGAKQYARALERSNAAYAAFMNHLRFELFNNNARFDPDNPKYLADVAMAINVMTGRGHGKTADVLGSPVMGTAFYAPRYVWSGWQATAGYPVLTAKTLKGKAMAAKLYGRQLALMGTAYTLAMAFGGEVEQDPRHSDFGVITLRDGTRIDLFSKWLQPIRLMMRIGTGSISRKEKFKAPSGYEAAGEVGRYITGKLSPAARLAWGAATEFKDLNEDTDEWQNSDMGKIYRDIVTPIAARNVVDKAKSVGPAAGLELLGIGIRKKPIVPKGTRPPIGFPKGIRQLIGQPVKD